MIRLNWVLHTHSFLPTSPNTTPIKLLLLPGTLTSTYKSPTYSTPLLSTPTPPCLTHMEGEAAHAASSSLLAAVTAGSSEDEANLHRGPWTVEEDSLLVNYIATHGEGRWNRLALAAGLRRTGKSCRLRWLNYLRPDVRRGNITPEEQLVILELHSRWGNRWSKIAERLPGRTDNEIKNFWRTRVQKHARQLRCDVDSERFKELMRRFWMPRLRERIKFPSAEFSSSYTAPCDCLPCPTTTLTTPPQAVASSTHAGESTDESCGNWIPCGGQPEMDHSPWVCGGVELQQPPTSLWDADEELFFFSP